MKPQHLQAELDFYTRAYADEGTRNDRGFGWDYQPSPSLVALTTPILSQVQRVLDVGVGSGRHTAHFLTHDCEVVGVDFCSAALELTRQRLGDRVHLHQADLTELGCLSGLGQFDLVIDWSVMDHIRGEYLEVYKQNLLDVIASGGYLLTSQFAAPFDPPPAFPQAVISGDNRDVVMISEHYSKAYTPEELIAAWRPLELRSQLLACPEDKVNFIRLHTMLFQKR